MVRYRANPAMSTLPFDKIDSVEGFAVHDDFIDVIDVADATDTTGVAVSSQYPWVLSEVSGAAAGSLDHSAGVADHPGIISLATGATIPADGDIVALSFGSLGAADANAGIVLDSNGVYMAAVVKISDVDATKFQFALEGQAPAAVNSSAADLVGFVWDPEDAANVADELFICQVNGAGTDVEEVASLVTYVENDWVLLELAVDDTSATFRITTEDNTQTITLDGSDSISIPAMACRPVFTVETVGAAEETVEVDLFHLRYLRRTEPWSTSGYLGA